MDFSRFANPYHTAEHAERMGYDAGVNGPNTTNCHFALFARKELTAAWERGKKRGAAGDERKDG